MKIHWGYGILATIVAFTCMIFFMIYKASHIDLDLVAGDYYAQEVAYQAKLDKINRTLSLPQKPTATVLPDAVKIQFPEYFRGKQIEGQVYFFRPSSSGLDLHVPLQLDSGLTQIIPNSGFKSGMYIVKTDWTADKKEGYFQEENLFIP